MKHLLFLVVAVASCAPIERGLSDATGVSAAAGSAADNVGNEPDRTPPSPTPPGENETDRTITQLVRRGVAGRDGLSMDADNVKIDTVDRVVTLRGPVISAQERSTIGIIAELADGVVRVDNQLQIANR